MLWVRAFAFFVATAGSRLLACADTTAQCSALDTLQTVGEAMAGALCSESPPSDTSQLAMDLVGAVESVAQCESVAAGDAASRVSTAFVDAQTCSCLPAEGLIHDGVSALVQDVGDVADNAQNLVDSAIVFSQEYCEPGTVDGVLDQDANECIALAAGNATAKSSSSSSGEDSRAVGLMAAGTLCEDSGVVNADSKEQAIESVTSSMAQIVMSAVAEAERACSLNPAGLCVLSRMQVRDIARSQFSSFAEGLWAPNTTCEWNGTAGNSLMASFASSTALTHENVCSNSQSEFDDGAAPLSIDFARMVSAMYTSLGFVEMQSASPPRSQTLAPFARCGPSASSRRSAVRGCCPAGFHCLAKNAFYAQCRPVVDNNPDGWAAKVIFPKCN